MSQRYEGSSNRTNMSDTTSSNDFGTTGTSATSSQDYSTGGRRNVQELGRMAKDVAGDTLENLRENASEYVEKGRTALRDFEGQFVRQVRTNPVKSLLIAAGAGLALGFVLKSSK